MDRQEFLARWEAYPHLKKAELIEGVVYAPSPVSLPHGSFDGCLHLWLSQYCLHTPGCQILTNTTWMLLDSSPQPDIAMRWLPEAGGLSSNTKKGDYPEGPPELVIEICRSSRSYDLGPKLALYRKAGVPEYLALLLEERRVEWRALRNHRYTLLGPGRDGMLKSRVFPGLWLDPEALLAGNLQALAGAVAQGRANEETVRTGRR
jgi:Uma2 family endonuclease